MSVLCPRSKRPPGAREYLPPANLPVVRARSDFVTKPRGLSTKASNDGSLPICALRRSLLSTSARPSQIPFRPSTLIPVNTRQFTWNIEVPSLERRRSSPRGIGFQRLPRDRSMISIEGSTSCGPGFKPPLCDWSSLRPGTAALPAAQRMGPMPPPPRSPGLLLAAGPQCIARGGLWIARKNTKAARLQ